MLSEMLMQSTFAATIVSAHSAPANGHQDQSANVKTTKEVKGNDEAGVRALQCQFHKPQILLAGGGETNYDGSRATINSSCVVAKLAQIVEIKILRDLIQISDQTAPFDNSTK